MRTREGGSLYCEGSLKAGRKTSKALMVEEGRVFVQRGGASVSIVYVRKEP
jgi:hypothetical protein